MFIPKYIKNISFDGKKLQLNNLVVEYKNNDFDLELTESFISKGAYASLLLYLNSSSLVESINNKKINESQYNTFLNECKDMLKECVYKAKAQDNFKPLCNISGLEILENDNYIARGKNILFLEDFRENTTAGLPDSIVLLIDNFKDNSNSKEAYFEVLNKLSELEWNNDVTTDDYNRALSIVNNIMRNARTDVNEEASGTQVGDIAPKVDQNVTSKVVKPPKVKKFTESLFNVKFNHGYKGFRLTSRGTYERGNYILINECEEIKAVNKNRIDEYANRFDEYGNILFKEDRANIIMTKVCNILNKEFSLYDYDFSYRIENDGNDYKVIKIFDKNEYFDYEDKNFDKVNELIKKYLGDTVYLEPENKVIMTIAGSYVEN